MVKARGQPIRTAGIFLQAAVVGVLGGFLGVGFRRTVSFLQELMMGHGGSVSDAGALISEWWLVILIPAGGGLLAGLCLLAIRNQRGPFGITDVMELVVTRKGTIRPVRAVVQILSSAFSISSGGSIGREGANSQFGATVGAVLARWFKTSSRSRAILLGCGIAAGMASAYKAPIAGAMFVMEVVLGNFAMDVFAPIVVASVLSTLVTFVMFGSDSIYAGEFGIDADHWPLILSAVVLGAMCGPGAIAFRRSLEFGKWVFDKIPAPLAFRMALGGALVGCIGIWYPEVWGNGQATIVKIQSASTFTLLAALVLWKVVATGITVGSGALGGVFTPNLVVGAAFGAAFANVVNWIAPTADANQAAFALIGMAGMCAATTHAPITAIILIFELTQDYGLILPVMLCSILGSISSRVIDKDSIYSARLRARGHPMHSGLEELALHANYVRDIIRRDHVRVVQTAPFDDVLELFNTTRRDTVYVTDDAGVLIGHIQLHDVKYFLNDATLGTVVIAADLTRTSPFTHADETLASIIQRFDDPDLDELPVVASAENPILQGRITRRDLVTCLSEEVLGERKLRAKLKAADSKEATYVELPRGCRLERVNVPESLVDRAVDSLDLRGEYGLVVLLLVHRDANNAEQRSLPRAEDVLQRGMSMIVVGQAEDIQRFRHAHGD